MAVPPDRPDQVRVEPPSQLQLRLLAADVVRDVRRVARRPWLRNRPTASSASVRLVTTASVNGALSTTEVSKPVLAEPEREFGRFRAAAAASGQAPPPVSVPVGFTTFPGELWAAPRGWVETVYPGLAYFNEVDKGGHFAAWEEPDLFATEVPAAFRPLRKS